MPSQDCIDVRIHVDGQPLREYKCPDEQDLDDLSVKRYIEVKAGQRFTIVCRATAGFPLHNAPFLHFQISFDNMSVLWSRSLKLPATSSKINILLRERQISFERSNLLDEATGQWYEAYYVFGAFGTSEQTTAELAATPEFHPAAIDMIGSITVCAYRAKKRRLTTPYIFNEALEQTPDQLPEAFLKGRDIKNNIKLQAGKSVAAPLPQLFEYVPIDDDHGDEYEFIFMCRSRNTEALQNLDCIPRSPSPSPDRGLINSRNEALLEEYKTQQRNANRELVKLREQLARTLYAHEAGSVVDLEGEANTNSDARLWIKHEPGIKQEPGVKPKSGTTDASIRGRKGKPEDGIDGIRKRLRSTTITSSAGTVVEVPAPPKPEPEFIDLTDDD